MSKAAEYYKQSGDLGHAQANYKLARMAHEGKGVAQVKTLTLTVTLTLTLILTGLCKSFQVLSTRGGGGSYEGTVPLSLVVYEGHSP